MEKHEVEEFYTVREFAKLLKISQETIRRAIRAGKIIALKPGGGETSSLRIPRLELDRMAQNLMYGEQHD